MVFHIEKGPAGSREEEIAIGPLSWECESSSVKFFPQVEASLEGMEYKGWRIVSRWSRSRNTLNPFLPTCLPLEIPHEPDAVVECPFLLGRVDMELPLAACG